MVNVNSPTIAYNAHSGVSPVIGGVRGTRHPREADRVVEQGFHGPDDLQIWPEIVHVWHLFHPELKAGRRAIEEGGAFVQARTAEKSG